MFVLFCLVKGSLYVALAGLALSLEIKHHTSTATIQCAMCSHSIVSLPLLHTEYRDGGNVRKTVL